MKNKLNEWAKRYLPSEILSLIVTLIAAELTFHYTQNKITTALVGTVVGNISYFGYILLVDIFSVRKECLRRKQKYTFVIFLKNVRALFVEFGFSETVDLFVIRPSMMYYFPILVNNLTFGTFLAKITADITFYLPTIFSYELSKKKLRNFHVSHDNELNLVTKPIRISKRKTAKNGFVAQISRIKQNL